MSAWQADVAGMQSRLRSLGNDAGKLRKPKVMPVFRHVGSTLDNFVSPLALRASKPTRHLRPQPPFTLRQHDLVGIVDEVLVGKHLEKGNCLLLVRINATRWRLIRPAYNAIRGMIAAERRKVLRIPRIIHALHILQVLASIHNVTSNLTFS